jgi:hypothetical protein
LQRYGLTDQRGASCGDTAANPTNSEVRALAHRGSTRNRSVSFPRSSEPLELVLPITPHDLRHTAASLAISAGANPKAVQWLLGLASTATKLDAYANLLEDDLDIVPNRANGMRIPQLWGFSEGPATLEQRKPRKRSVYGAFLLCARRDLNPRPIDP